MCQGIRYWWKCFSAFFIQMVAICTMYRAQSILWMISKAMPLIMLMIWRHLAQDGKIGGYSREDFSLYYIFLFVAYQLTPVWVIYRMDQAIRQGELAPKLLWPINPMWHMVAEHWAEMTIRLPIILGIFVIGMFLSDVTAQVPWENLPLFAFALFLGWWVTFTMHYALAALVFWTDSVTYFDSLIFRLFILFGGVSLPLTFYPTVIQKILFLSPFPYVFYFPTQIMTGKLSSLELFHGFGLALLWIGLFTLLHRFLWRLGLRQFSAVGQ